MIGRQGGRRAPVIPEWRTEETLGERNISKAKARKVYNNGLRQDELGPGTYVEGGEEEEHNTTDTGRPFCR